MLDSILHDVRYAARSLVRRPGITALAVGILALGLGINTAVFAVSYGVLWKPLPYPDADRLVTIVRVHTEDGSESGVRLHQFDEWNRRLRTMRVAGYDTRERVVRGPGPARVLEVATVSDDFFEVLGVPAAQGWVPRLANGDVRAVISRTFARALETETGQSALGQAVTVGEGRYEVAAVMPGEFAFPSADVNVWLAARAVTPEESGWYEVWGVCGTARPWSKPAKTLSGSPTTSATSATSCGAPRHARSKRRCAANCGLSCGCRSQPPCSCSLWRA